MNLILIATAIAEQFNNFDFFYRLRGMWGWE